MTSTAQLTTASAAYLTGIGDLLEIAVAAERQAIAAAGALIADRFNRDGLLHVFGSGHSHVFAEEAFYRAGGAARISPVLVPEHMLHLGARRSTELERELGHAQGVLSGYTFSPERDVMLVVSNSGSNALPVEVAQLAKSNGLPVVAITSRQYATASLSPGIRLHDVADIVIDNHCPPGDAIVSFGDARPRVGPASSVIGLSLLNAVIVEALALQVAGGIEPDVFLSAGMSGARAHNAELAARFAARIPHI